MNTQCKMMSDKTSIRISILWPTSPAYRFVEASVVALLIRGSSQSAHCHSLLSIRARWLVSTRLRVYCSIPSAAPAPFVEPAAAVIVIARQQCNNE